MTSALNASVTAIFSDDGNGGTRAVAQMGPQVYGTDWRVTRIVTTVDIPNDPQSHLRVYAGSENPSNLVDGTYAADQDVSDTVIDVKNLTNLIFVWTGGYPSARATAIVSGQVVGRR